MNEVSTCNQCGGHLHHSGYGYYLICDECGAAYGPKDIERMKVNNDKLPEVTISENGKVTVVF